MLLRRAGRVGHRLARAAAVPLMTKGSARFMSRLLSTVAPEMRATHVPPKVDIDRMFGSNSFDAREQRKYLSPKVFKQVQECIKTRQPLSSELTDHFAAALHRWATARNVTHFTHWFTPMTGRSASKHDSFFVRSGDAVISDFTGKTLAIGEPDASSFPNGGLRQTHQARGYTVWDPSSPAFVIEHDNGATLCIPSVFFSWKGDALDEKIPLLRSNLALEIHAMAMLEAAGQSGHKHVFADAGIEQEFFLVDKNFALKRPDLLQTGRTLVGKQPPKGQDLSDHYFTDLSQRAMNVINMAEKELWKLGIPQTTRHKEVAPGQYEIAPVFSEVGEAADRNLMTMEVLGRVAQQCGMEVLFHEKPFAGLNGSGKHNNWSIGTNLMGTVFEPTSTPQKNDVFMLFLTAMIRAVDLHQDLMRTTVASIENDHRLGGHEAPPAIVSVFLGDAVSGAIDRFMKDDMTPFDTKRSIDIGVSGLPDFKVHASDRNRTSPFAFTGNKFEFRAVGSSQPIHRSSTLLNTIAAESCQYLAEQITARTGPKASAKERKEAARAVCKEVLQKHRHIVFDGDCYSPEWTKEAEKRGLLNIPKAYDTFGALRTAKNKDLFSSMGVFSPEETEARSNVLAEEYTTKAQTEAASLLSLVNTRIIPAVSSTMTDLPQDHGNQANRYDRVSKLMDHLMQEADELETLIAQPLPEDALHAAQYMGTYVLPVLESIRELADQLEGLCSSEDWPLPTYHQMLFTGQHYDVSIYDSH